ncbi:YppG family protein [Tuberibacillus sp. Marseille-P3662]|uniref:YppG family protein n=1 Tax=Tuberibacillus sp. Marseille-P3662 TaxID=1965358 RepID=UPI000A1CE6DE|nr:YppG family protein [Tuberibacillus sp. Marseille-P3662]
MARQNNDQGPPVDPFNQMMFFGPPTGPPPQQQSQDQQPNQTQDIKAMMSSFMDDNGNLDMNKLMDGADQVFKMVDKTKPMIKQLSPLLNMFKKQ